MSERLSTASGGSRIMRREIYGPYGLKAYAEMVKRVGGVWRSPHKTKIWEEPQKLISFASDNQRCVQFCT